MLTNSLIAQLHRFGCKGKCIAGQNFLFESLEFFRFEFDLFGLSFGCVFGHVFLEESKMGVEALLCADK
ncbi:MAG: hypothetical protein S4CHLAM102_11510 [Chlamydiia bacterium]|nr:hypothetical protein [Chlamydiia bacterium]